MKRMADSRVIVISASDNVATALQSLAVGETIAPEGRHVPVRDPIPSGHKIALTHIASGQPIVKYGSTIGTATVDIAEGAHVHTHNVASGRGRGDLASARTREVAP
jgi:hypothetical protein